MTKKELFEIIKGDTVKISELDVDNSYIFTLEVGNESDEQVSLFCYHLHTALIERLQLKHFIIIPIRDGLPALKIYEFKDGEQTEVE